MGVMDGGVAETPGRCCRHCSIHMHDFLQASGKAAKHIRVRPSKPNAEPCKHIHRNIHINWKRYGEYIVVVNRRRAPAAHKRAKEGFNTQKTDVRHTRRKHGRAFVCTTVVLIFFSFLLEHHAPHRCPQSATTTTQTSAVQRP